ncbi:4Fe-4S binding protein [Colwellia sp. 20A7]|uniref:4Fe-4S binding protein n=1 Tax=Colwellia sp. 20A7 TaxID=2689569 RepID=UPI001356B848|nr:4Fe-4S binding protein [Colwellia sp. 20A7]
MHSKKVNPLMFWVTLTLFLMFSPSFHATAFNTQESPNAASMADEIYHIFPSATRIGPVDKEIPVTPVYQLNELLGYVFESDDFVNFIGFSGQTINVLIGIDTEGVFTGLKILKHNEPIFLHGLGEEPMFDFIKQFKGHSVKERFIVNARNKDSLGATFIDGVTKATISVLVINDTITASAIQVARERLSGFVAPSRTSINPDYYKPLTFSELLSENLVTHWQVTRDQALAIVDKSSTSLINKINQVSEGENDFIDLYFAFVHVPIIGKNLLGEQEYQRLIENLKPGEHALMVFGHGKYAFVSEEFIPQTVPSRLSGQQATLPVDLRDIDFYSYYEPSFAQTVPDFNNIKVFRIKSQSGFELNKNLSLSLTLNYNQSFLSKNQYSFTIDNILPDNLFIHKDLVVNPEENRPLWLKIWIDRTVEIILLSAYLIFLSWLFIKQETIAKNVEVTHKLRFASLTFVLFFIGFYSQGQLSVVNIYTLFLSIWQGFNINVFLLDPIIFILWVFVFISLFLFGRGLFCGWLCPFGALQEFAALIAKKLKIKQIKIKPHHHSKAQKIKYVVLILLVGSSFYSLTIAEKLAEIEPFKTSITLNFVRYWPFVLYVVLLLALSLKIHKFYCRYLCPLGAGLAIIGRYPMFKWLRRRKECGSSCQLCRNKKCGIDAINQDGSIDYGECIQCLECLVTIESPQLCVVNKYANKPNKKNKAPTPPPLKIKYIEL